jgi:hypothetical protein
MHPVRVLRTLFVAGLFAGGSLWAVAPGVAAYGRADQPLAQIEFSANCNNPAIFLCFPPPAGFGLGGIWLWIEIDANQTGDVAGAGCGHVRGIGGGAGPIKGDVTWWSSTTPDGLAFNIDPHGRYYNVLLPDGTLLSLPQTQGHYQFTLGHGTTVQTTIAP